MPYKIEIYELKTGENLTYSERTVKIYEQTKCWIDVSEVVAVVNDLKKEDDKK
jgi:hypothetical protein